MRSKNRIALVFGIGLPYMCAVLALVFYHAAHPGPIPRWIFVTMFFMFVLTIVGGSVAFYKIGSKEAAGKPLDKEGLRRERAAKWLKVGLVVWTVILLNDIRMLAQQSIPWRYAIPGVIVVLLMVAVFWTSLRRMQKNNGGGIGS
jgi:hypothetical protein